MCGWEIWCIILFIKGNPVPKGAVAAKAKRGGTGISDATFPRSYFNHTLPMKSLIQSFCKEIFQAMLMILNGLQSLLDIVYCKFCSGTFTIPKSNNGVAVSHNLNIPHKRGFSSIFDIFRKELNEGYVILS